MLKEMHSIYITSIKLIITNINNLDIKAKDILKYLYSFIRQILINRWFKFDM